MKRTRRPTHKNCRRRKGWSSVRRLTFEPLETRQLLAVLMVNSIDDVFDPVDGLVTLREAIIAANTDSATELGDMGSGADEIQFDPNLFTSGPVTLTLSSLGHISIASDLTISGPGEGLLTIRAFDPTPAVFNADGSRIFEVGGLGLPTNPIVTLSSLTLTGGDVDGFGGAIYSSNAALTVMDAVITGNSASSSGGGIFARSGLGFTDSIVIQRSTITGNMAGGSGGGIYASTAGQFTLEESTVSENLAQEGGGLFLEGPSTIINSTISGNTALMHGGGIYGVLGLTISNSTISGNSAYGSGGGIYTAILNELISISHSTITANEADADVDGAGSGGGAVIRSSIVSLEHNIIAGNSGPESDLTGNGVIPIIATVRFNLIGSNSGNNLPPAPVGMPDQDGNLIGTPIAPIDPLLTGLDDFGGPTKTHLLIPGSPAFDAGDPLAFPGANGVPLTDQRGFSRLQGLAIDMGAFEVEVFSGTPPDLFSPGPQTANEGAIFDLSQLFVFNDDGSGPYSAIVNWGDGSLPEFVGASGGFIFASHVYADDGSYNIQIQLDNPFGSDFDSFLIDVSNVAPNLTVVGDQTITVGDPLNLIDLGSITDPGFDNLPLGNFETFDYFIDWKDGSIPDTGTATIDTPGNAIQPTLATFDGSHNYAAPGTYTVTVRLADDDMSGDFAAGVAGVDYVEQTFIVMVDPLPPDLVVPGPQLSNEGDTFDLSQFSLFTDDGFSSYSAIVDWGDGSLPENASASSGMIFADHVYADDGIYTIQIQLDTAFGSDADSFQVTVNNVAPNLVVVGNQQLTVGDPLNLINLGNISDPGFDNQDLSSFESFSYFIDWDDGSAPDTGTAAIDTPGNAIQPTLASFDGSHNYAAPGTYTVTVRIADDDMSGDFATGVAGVDYVEQTFTVIVDGLPPALSVPGLQLTNEAATFDLSQFVFFSDDGFSPYSAIVNWGDGSLPENVAASGGAITASHVYADDGNYTVQIQLDNAFGSDSDSFQVTVNNVAPNLVVVGNQQLTVGDPLNLIDLGSISDPGFDNLVLGSFEAISYFIDWDDGSSPDTGTANIDTPGNAIQPTLASFDGSHNYATPGTYTVTVRVADDDMSGDFTSGVAGVDYVEQTFEVMVDGLPPMLSVPGPQLANEGATFDLSSITFFTDDGFSPYSAIVNWGDGSLPENVVASGGAILASHVYADDGVYTVQIQLDNAFGSDSDNFLVTVNNVAPDLSVVGDRALTMGDTLVLIDLGNISDPGFDNQSLGSFEAFQYYIDWNDGTTPDTGMATIDMSGGVGQPTLASFDGSHLFASAGTFTVTVRVADDDMSGDFLSGVAGVDYVEMTFVVITAPVPIIEQRFDANPPIAEFPGDEIVGIDPRTENTTLLILIGIPLPPNYPDLNNGSGGNVLPPPLNSAAKTAELALAEQTLQATLQRPHEVRREELIDAVFDLGEIELVGLLGIDMGDDPILPEKKDEKAKPEEKKDQEVRKPVVGSEEAATLPKESQPAEEESAASLPDAAWPAVAFWLALAGTGSIWASGAWWVRRGKRKHM